jgi:hypothetical protein
MDVGIEFGVVLPLGVNDRLLVRLMIRPPGPVGTVITTGDQVPGGVVVDDGFSAAHVAVDPVTAAPQK